MSRLLFVHLAVLLVACGKATSTVTSDASLDGPVDAPVDAATPDVGCFYRQGTTYDAGPCPGVWWVCYDKPGELTDAGGIAGSSGCGNAKLVSGFLWGCCAAGGVP